VKTAPLSAACLAATALVIGGAVAGCSKDKSSTPPASSAAPSSSASTSSQQTSAAATTAAAPAAPGDYSSLLVAATEVGSDTVAQGPPQLNPSGNPGVGQVFASPDGKRRVVDTILVFPDAATAESNFDSNNATMNQSVTGAPQPATIGTKGSVATGTTPDGSKAVTVVLFSEGRALVNMSFESTLDEGIPQNLALQIAQKQDDAIQTGLPG
jgi:hypothetical protein